MSAEARANISAGLLRRREAAEQAAEIVNGHGALPMTGRQIAKAGVRALAIEGAKLRLVKLDQERETLLIFIKGGARATKTEATESE